MAAPIVDVEGMPSAAHSRAASARDANARDASPAPGTPPKAAANGRPWLLPLIVFALVAAAALFSMSPYPVGIFQDDGIYVILAESIATGQGYRYLHLPGTPAATHYPPGYPLLLAALWKLSSDFPRNLALFKLVNALLAAVGAAGAFWFARRRLALPAWAAAVAAVLSGAGIPTLVTAALVLSEPLFLALLFPALVAADRLADPDARPSPTRALAVGLLCAVLILVRTVAVVVVPAVLMVMLFRRRAALRGAAASTLAFVIGAVAPLVPWQLFQARHAGELPLELQGKYGSYSGWLVEGFRQEGAGFGVDVLARNALELRWMTELFFALGTPQWWRPVAAAVALALFLLGLWRGLARSPVAALFTLAYCGIVALWPFPPARFVCAIWPLALAFVALGAAEVWGWQPAPSEARGPRARWGPPARLAALALSALALVGQLPYFVQGYRHRFWDAIARSRTPAAIATMQWVASSTRPGDVIGSDEESMVWLYTRRQSVPLGAFTAVEYLREPSGAELARDLRGVLRAYDVRWVIPLSGPSKIAADSLQRAAPPALRFVTMLPNQTVPVLTPVRR